MGRNLNDLAISLEKKAKAIDKAASKVAIDTALALVRELVNHTPVDTSAALSNWQVSLDSAKFNFINPYVPGDFGYTAAASSAQALGVAIGVLGKKKPGQTIFISNNAPYIRDLNSGTSKQAPAGFVESAVMVIRKQIPKIELD